MGVRIPLFPLGVVLYPHMPLPIHVFEERYRVMLGDCEERGIGFGVVAIREGLEVGRTATPHRVGTLAQLRGVERLTDGRLLVDVVGASRYRIVRLLGGRPYLVGEVEYLADEAGDPADGAALAARVGAAFSRYTARLRELAGAAPAALDLPDEPELLSYLVAATLQVETLHKQQLLELDSAEDRLRLCLRLLRRELTLLDRRLARRESPIAAVSAN